MTLQPQTIVLVACLLPLFQESLGDLGVGPAPPELQTEIHVFHTESLRCTEVRLETPSGVGQVESSRIGEATGVTKYATSHLDAMHASIHVADRKYDRAFVIKKVIYGTKRGSVYRIFLADETTEMSARVILPEPKVDQGPMRMSWRDEFGNIIGDQMQDGVVHFGYVPKCLGQFRVDEPFSARGWADLTQTEDVCALRISVPRTMSAILPDDLERATRPMLACGLVGGEFFGHQLLAHEVDGEFRIALQMSALQNTDYWLKPYDPFRGDPEARQIYGVSEWNASMDFGEAFMLPLRPHAPGHLTWDAIKETGTGLDTTGNDHMSYTIADSATGVALVQRSVRPPEDGVHWSLPVGRQRHMVLRVNANWKRIDISSDGDAQLDSKPWNQLKVVKIRLMDVKPWHRYKCGIWDEDGKLLQVEHKTARQYMVEEMSGEKELSGIIWVEVPSIGANRVRIWNDYRGLCQVDTLMYDDSGELLVSREEWVGPKYSEISMQISDHEDG